MNDLQFYQNPQFGEIRIVSIDGAPWFVGKDVAAILGYSKPLNALATHVDEDDSLKQGLTDSMGRIQQTILINESGLYSLILSSKLPTAKEFKRWVTSEVLPSIRKHNAYMTPDMIEKVLTDPDVLINLAQQLKAERAKVAELQPKAAYYDLVADCTGLMSFRETAKLFRIPERIFIRFIEESRLCYRAGYDKLVPYAEYMRAGWFEVKEVVCESYNQTLTLPSTKITPVGRTKIFDRLRKAGMIHG